MEWADDYCNRVIPFEAKSNSTSLFSNPLPLDDKNMTYVFYLDRQGHFWHKDVVKAIFAREGADKGIQGVGKDDYKGISKVATLPYVDVEAVELK